MKKLFTRALAVVMALSMGGFASLFAQQIPQLPVDSAVRVGKLPNGLTYYIRHNETPKGQADFYIAQKVGSILEDDNQRGLAHFLEHMCFNGTTNFPEKGIIKWLETKGVKFGQNLNAYTGVDETVYNISNVPVADKNVQDSCLLILHDWACDLTLDNAEIDAERAVIHEEWRQAMKGNMRIMEKLLPTAYPNSKYGYRLPIGTMDVVDNFPYQVLKDYYHKWYRPDQQGIIVVGDIDPDYIEAKIKEIFTPIKMPENAAERIYVQVEDTPGTIYAIGSDPEMPVAVFMLFAKSDPLPDEMKNTPVFYQMQYMMALVAGMLNERFSDLSRNPDCPFAQASASYGEFFLSKTKDAFSIQGVAKGPNITGAYEAIYREVLRAIRGGFTQNEFDRAKAEFMSRIEKLYNERKNTNTASYVQEYVDNFLDGNPIPGIETDYQIYQQLSQMIPLAVINQQLLPELMSKDNRVLMVMRPEGEGYVNPTEQQLAEITAKVDAEEIEAFTDNTKTEPLIPQLPAPGKIVKEQKLAQWDAIELTLSNGVKVIVKPTTFKENNIVMEAIAIGGTSNVSDDLAATMKFFDYGASMNGAFNYTNADLDKYLQGKQASVRLGFSSYSRSISGSTTVKDLPVLMELLYADFVGYKIYPDEFSALQNMVEASMANQVNTPEYAFQRDLMKSLFASPKKQAPTIEDIKQASCEQTEKIAKEMLANAADYTFVFVGNIDMDTFRPLVEQYIATLPANAKKATNKVTYQQALEPATGSATDKYTTKMQTPQTWVFLGIQGNLPYSAKNRTMASMAGQILSQRLLSKVREEMGAVYSIGMSGSMSRQGLNNVMLQTAFPMKPELRDETLAVIHDIIYNLAENCDESELAPVKEFMVKEAKHNEEENSSWAGTISATKLNGVDVFNNSVETINSVTTDDIKKFMKQLLNQNNYYVVTLDAAE